MKTPTQATGEICPKSAQAEGETRQNPTETLASLIANQRGVTERLSCIVDTIYLIAQFQPEDYSSLKGALNLCSYTLLEICESSMSIEGSMRSLLEGGNDDDRETC